MIRVPVSPMDWTSRGQILPSLPQPWLTISRPEIHKSEGHTTFAILHHPVELTNNPTITALPLPNLTLTVMPKIKCGPDIYGHPPVTSCWEALSLTPDDLTTIGWNPKLSIEPRGLGPWDFPLPKRFMS